MIQKFLAFGILKSQADTGIVKMYTGIPEDEVWEIAKKCKGMKM